MNNNRLWLSIAAGVAIAAAFAILYFSIFRPQPAYVPPPPPTAQPKPLEVAPPPPTNLTAPRETNAIVLACDDRPHRIDIPPGSGGVIFTVKCEITWLVHEGEVRLHFIKDIVPGRKWKDYGPNTCSTPAEKEECDSVAGNALLRAEVVGNTKAVATFVTCSPGKMDLTQLKCKD